MSLPAKDGLPAVSIIIPAYRVTAYIGETLDSVLAQTFRDYEAIVVNDGCPDSANLERVLEPYQPHIRYIRQENAGLAATRNTAIRASRGEFLALLDSDDAWEPNYLEVQVGKLRDDPSVDVLYPNAIFFGDPAFAGKTFMELNPSEGPVTVESLFRQTCNVFVSVTARREAVFRAGLFDGNLRSVEDFDLWLRILKTGGRIAYHRQPLVRFRRRPGSLSSDPIWMSTHVLKVLDKVEAELSLTDAEQRESAAMRRRYQATLDLAEGKKALETGDFQSALRRLSAANRHFRSLKTAMAIWGLHIWPPAVRYMATRSGPRVCD